MSLLLYFFSPASQGGQWQSGLRGHLVSSWGNSPPWEGYMTKKKQNRPIWKIQWGKWGHLSFSQLQEYTENQTPATVNLSDCTSTEGKRVLFKYVPKKQIKNTPDKRHSQPAFIAWECFFYGQLINCSKQVLQSNENTVRTLAGAMAKGLSTWSLQWAQPNCSSPSSLQTGQHCLCRWCRAAAVKSGWHIKLMTKQWWQTSRQWSWDRKHDCQNTDREEQKKPAQTLPQNPPRTAWKDSENLSQNANWEFSQAASQSVSTRAARAQLSSDSCSSSHLSLELLGALSQS